MGQERIEVVQMVRYLVQAGDWSKIYAKTLKDARRYAYYHTLSGAGNQTYIYSDTGRIVGRVHRSGGMRYWTDSKGKMYWLENDGTTTAMASR